MTPLAGLPATSGEAPSTPAPAGQEVPPPAPGPAKEGRSIPDRAVAALQGMSLRTRLIAILLGLLLVALALTSAATAALMNRDLITRTDANLRKSAAPVAQQAFNQIAANRQNVRLPSGYAVIFFPTMGAPVRVLPTDEDAEPDLAELALSDPRVTNPAPFTLRSISGPVDWRAIAGRTDDDTATFIVAVPLRGVHTTVVKLVRTTSLIGLGVIAACVLLGWFATRRAFRPLTQIEDTAAAIASGDLSSRIPSRSAPTEVASLSTSLNAMLSHIERSFSLREASEERMRQFVADASHELRTPLATVRGYAELYRQGAVRGDAAVAGAMQRIESEASRMTSLVDDLLLLARLDERRPLDRRPVDLTVVAADEVQAARVRDPSRRIVLQGRDAPLGQIMVEGDEGGLHQVLGNLLTNAIRHTPDGSPVEVSVGTIDDGATAVVEVVDHGLGIDDTTSTRIFERFFRADAARSRASGGTGLGLAIVAAIVARHDGRVGLSQTPGGGATFVVHLPTGKSQVGPRTG